MKQKPKKKFKSTTLFIVILFLILGISWLIDRVRYTEHSGVQITANNEANVEINGISVGKTPYYASNMDAGTVDVQMTDTKSGQVWKEKITLNQGSLTSVHRDFGDVEYKSHGYVLNMEKQNSSSASAFITSTPTNASVSIDGKPQGFTPFTIDVTPGSPIFTFTYQGYEDKIIYASPMSGYRLKMNFTMALLETTPSAIPREKNDNEILVIIGKNEVVLSPTYIDINVGFDSPNPKEIRLNQTNFQYLFKYNNTQTRLHVEEFSGGGYPETKLIYISGQVPNHGDIVDHYYIIIDPEIGKVVEDGYNLLFGNVHLNNSCTNCFLPGLLFKEYSRKEGGFVLTNNKHRKEFQDLLKQYEKFESTETCRIDKKDYLLSEALKIAKDTDRCVDLGMGGMYPDATNDSFITIGEYKEIVSNIKNIIKGENIFMFNRGYYGKGLAPLIRSFINSKGDVIYIPIDREGKENFYDQESIDNFLGISSFTFNF